MANGEGWRDRSSVAADLLGVTENETQITGKAGGSAGRGGRGGRGENNRSKNEPKICLVAREVGLLVGNFHPYLYL